MEALAAAYVVIGIWCLCLTYQSAPHSSASAKLTSAAIVVLAWPVVVLKEMHRPASRYRLIPLDSPETMARVGKIVAMLVRPAAIGIKNPSAGFLFSAYEKLWQSPSDGHPSSVLVIALEEVLRRTEPEASFDSDLRQACERIARERAATKAAFRAAGGHISSDDSSIDCTNGFRFGLTSLSEKQREMLAKLVADGLLRSLSSSEQFVEVVRVQKGIPLIEIGDGAFLASEYDIRTRTPLLMGFLIKAND